MLFSAYIISKNSGCQKLLLKTTKKSLHTANYYCRMNNINQNSIIMIEVRSRRRYGSRQAEIISEAIFAESVRQACRVGGHMVNSHMTVYVQ